VSFFLVFLHTLLMRIEGIPFSLLILTSSPSFTPLLASGAMAGRSAGALSAIAPIFAQFFLTFLISLVAGVPTRTRIEDFARVLSFASNIRKKKDGHRRRSRLGPLEWSRRYAKIRTAEGRVYDFRDVERSYQTDLLSDGHTRIIVGKSRQLGISNTCAFIAAEEAIAGGTVLVVSKNLEQAAQFLAYVYIALSDAPHPRFLKQNKYSLEFVGGGSIVCQPATKKAGRGIAATLVILDESAWQLYAREIFTAILPTLSTTNGRLIVLSTPNGTGNLFQEQWDYANAETDIIPEPQDRTWSVHFLPWWVNPAWDDAWADKTREEMGDKEFAQEHDVDFAGSGLNVFSPTQITNLFRFNIEPHNPVKGHNYVKGFDIARSRDAFAGFVIDISTIPFSIARIEHEYKMEYPDQAGRIDDINRIYPGDCLVESNGPGDPVIGFLETPVIPFFTTAINKKNMIDSLVLLLDKRELVGPEHKPLKLQLTRYIRKDSGIEQDLVMALAIGAHHAGRPLRAMMVEAGGERAGMSAREVIEALHGLATGKPVVHEYLNSQVVAAEGKILETTANPLQTAEDLVKSFRLGDGR
jgi:hypothetical protein